MKYAIALVFVSVALGLEPANLLEFRGSSTQYRYADWMHTSDAKLASLSLVTDLYYVGGRGYNEANAGLGLLKQLGRGCDKEYAKAHPDESPLCVNLIPVAYAVIGEKEKTRGAKLALIGSFERGDWKGSLYLAHFARVGGQVGNYTLLDTGDVTRKITGELEGGVSTGFARMTMDGKKSWNPQYGPMVKWRDWSVSYRFGAGGRELRFGKVFVF